MGRVQEYADAVLDRVGEVMVGKREVVGYLPHNLFYRFLMR